MAAISCPSARTTSTPRICSPSAISTTLCARRSPAGLDGREVVKMATFNAAREYGFDDLGAVAPGYIADMQLVDTLDGCQPAAVFAEGRAGGGKRRLHSAPTARKATMTFPNTVNIPQIQFRRTISRTESPCERRYREGQGHRSPQDGNRILRDAAGDGAAGEGRLCGHQRPSRPGST